jgi:anti-sigma-K factor RskA
VQVEQQDVLQDVEELQVVVVQVMVRNPDLQMQQRQEQQILVVQVEVVDSQIQQVVLVDQVW